MPVAPGLWEVNARSERFVGPALLLLLREGATHGYDLAEALGGLVPDAHVDMGNLYRLLRSLEQEGIVASEWRDDRGERPKRVYELTDQGARLLDAWAEALHAVEHSIAGFLERYEQGD